MSRTTLDREYVAGGNSILARALLSPPTLGVRDPNNVGGFTGSGNDDGAPRIPNPVAAQTLNERTGATNRILGNVFAEYEIIDGLNFRTNLAADSPV